MARTPSISHVKPCTISFALSFKVRFFFS